MRDQRREYSNGGKRSNYARNSPERLCNAKVPRYQQRTTTPEVMDSELNKRKRKQGPERSKIRSREHVENNQEDQRFDAYDSNRKRTKTLPAILSKGKGILQDFLDRSEDENTTQSYKYNFETERASKPGTSEVSVAVVDRQRYHQEDLSRITRG